MPKGIPKVGPRKPGAGRKPGPATATLSYRVPISHMGRIDLAVKRMIKEILNEQNNDTIFRTNPRIT